MRTVAVRLILAFVVVAAVAVGLVLVLVNQATTESFNQYVGYGGRPYLERAALDLAAYYARGGSWEAVRETFDSVAQETHSRLVLVDANDIVLADSADGTAGSTFDQEGLQWLASPIDVNGQMVGEVYLLPGRMGNQGPGAGRGRGQGSQTGNMNGAVTTEPGQGASPEQDYLDTVNRSLITAGILAVALAIALGVALTLQITRPLRSLTAGVKRIAAGEMAVRVPKGGKDELGTLSTAFNDMAEKLESNVQWRKNLLADVSHELRTPLSVIEGTADGILDGVLEPNTDNIRAIKEEAELLNTMVADLRDLALAEAGSLRLELRIEDLNDIVVKAAHRWDKAAVDKGIRLDTRSASTPLRCDVDADRVTQIVGNLLSNAIRYTPPGGRVVTALRGESGQAVVSVEDTGQGLSDEEAAHVFDRFYRADKSRTRRSGGTGLGLAIVKQLTEAQGGRVWVTSKIGQGSAFFFALPLVGERE